MLQAERLLADRQRPLVERPRAGEVALALKDDGEVVEAGRSRAMLRAERLLAGRERPLEERSRGGEVALGLKQAGEVVEALRGVRMLGAERRSSIASARSNSDRAPSRSPWA